jgi:hypothetical protein
VLGEMRVACLKQGLQDEIELGLVGLVKGWGVVGGESGGVIIISVIVSGDNYFRFPVPYLRDKIHILE